MNDVAREDLQWLTPEHDDEGPDPADVVVHIDPVGLESLRSAFVDAFNARDLEGVLDLVSADVEFEFGDPSVEGREAMAEELVAIWERSPGVLLTRGFDDDSPCAVAWRPDEDGGWARAALLCFDVVDDLITLLEIPDDAETLASVTAEDPAGEEPDEWLEWDRDNPQVTPVGNRT